MTSLALSVDIVVCLAVGSVCFYAGYSSRRTRDLVAEIKQLRTREELEAGDQIVDSSPQHLKAKRDERERRGEEPIDEGESQIVGTKSLQKRAEEENAAREARLDKWMPGVRGGK